ncbi:MAG: radical SAM family heme chaperone HemW [Actinomycetota bacterium]
MEPVGVYVHIPFCRRHCDYCAFATWTDREHLIESYLDALALDVRRAVEGGLGPVATVFVGGGTPSLVPPERLVEALARLELVDGAEVTVECNPDDVTAHLLATYRAGGVNRISLGVQSMDDLVLQALGRSHDRANVERAVGLARQLGGLDVNLDLIYGGAGEAVEQWRRTVEAVVSLRPDHVSAYALTIEPGTPLADDPARFPDDDDQADKYLVADELLSAAGFENYEISNWSRPGQECRHNLLYWRQGDYVGFGCAAHSHRAGRRWWNVRTPERYIAAVEAGTSTERGAEELDPEARRVEGLQLSIRTSDGVPARSVPADVEHLTEVGLDGRARLTRDGRLLANEVAVRLS